MNFISDHDLLILAKRKRNPSVSQNTVDEFIGKVKAHLQTDESRKLIVEYAIAEVVETVFGTDERGKYLLAVIEGRAK